MKYIVTTDLNERGEKRSKLYHCSEPETLRQETCGGFDYKLAGAITHDNIGAAKTERNRLQKYYPSFKMYISTFEDKEIFIGMLKGTIQ